MLKNNRNFQKKHQKGQATIELAFGLPILIWIIFYALNAYFEMHTAIIGEKYAAMSLYQRLGNRAKFTVDDKDNRIHGREFMAVQFLDSTGKLPQRRIASGPATINQIVGICREPNCR